MCCSDDQKKQKKGHHGPNQNPFKKGAVKDKTGAMVHEAMVNVNGQDFHGVEVEETVGLGKTRHQTEPRVDGRAKTPSCLEPNINTRTIRETPTYEKRAWP